MANFSYDATSERMDYNSFGNEDNVLQRSVEEDLDDMVQRNIQDVLQQVGASEDGAYDDDACQPHNDLSSEELQQGNNGLGRVSQSLGLGSGLEASASGTAGAALPKNTRQGVNHRSGNEGQHQRMSVSGSGPGSKLRRQDSLGSSGGAAASASAAFQRSADISSTGAGGLNTALLDVPGQLEASLRLHKARIKALEEDLSRTNRVLVDREKQLAEALRELKELRSQAASWARDKKNLEGQLDRAKKQAAEAESTLRKAESQVREMAKADSRVERERRASEAEVRTRDVRFQRAVEEVERYKQLLSDVRSQEREAKGSAQQDSSRLLAENRKLERQRAELITAFKKQLKLIEVLKRQKVHLEAARALQFSEEEFMKTLEMGGA